MPAPAAKPVTGDALERLCRYIARPAVSNERISVNDRRQVMYRLKHSFRDGTTHVVLDPVDFIARLARPRPHVPAPISPDTTACSPRTASTATASSPNPPTNPPVSLIRLIGLP